MMEAVKGLPFMHLEHLAAWLLWSATRFVRTNASNDTKCTFQALGAL
jgi:hypothetical protein